MSNILKDAPNLAENNSAKDLNDTIRNLAQIADKDSLTELPVLAKDSHYLSRLERELARAAYKKTKIQILMISKTKRKKSWLKSARSTIKSKPAHSRVQARIDSIPDNLPATLNLNLPVSQRADDIVQPVIDNQVIIVAGETGSGKTTQLPKLAMLAGRGIQGRLGIRSRVVLLHVASLTVLPKSLARNWVIPLALRFALTSRGQRSRLSN